MLDFLKIDSRFMVEKTIPNDKFAKKTNCEVIADIKQIVWVASLRPSETGMTPFEDDLRIYEEIQILEVNLLSQTHIFDVARMIMSTIKYPVILFLKYNNKYRVSMSKLYKNRVDCDKYRIKSMIMTFLLFPDNENVPYVTQKILSALDIAQYAGMSLYEAHQKIFDETSNHKCKAMSQAKTRRLVEFLIGKPRDKSCDEIFAGCDIFEYHPPVYSQKGIVKRRASNHILAHDWEDVWVSLLTYERTRNCIAKREYNSMEELMYRFEEYSANAYSGW